MKKRDKNKIENTEELISSILDKITPEFQEEIDYRMNLASKIYSGIKAKSRNKSKFSDEMQVSPSIISRWISGTHNFESDTLFKIQKKLGIRLIDIESSFNFQNAIPIRWSYSIEKDIIEDSENAEWEPAKIVDIKLFEKIQAS